MIRPHSRWLTLLAVMLLPAYAQATKLSVPRFASIKSNEVNVRAGPAHQCPIEWVFVKKGEPVEIIAEYEQWRQIQDIKGEGGWVHLSLLSKKRYVIIVSKEIISLVKSPATAADQVIVKLSPHVRCQLKKCQDSWCKVKCKNYEGWLKREYLWGVYKDEKI